MTTQSWLGRLRDGLAKSTNRIAGGIAAALTRRRLDDEALEELEDTLIMADIGPDTAAKLIAKLRDRRFEKDVAPEEVQSALADIIIEILSPIALPMTPKPSQKPTIVLVAGVNGSGKTTTIGKLAKYFSESGKSVYLAAGDTFRAAAIEQLQVADLEWWTDRHKRYLREVHNHVTRYVEDLDAIRERSQIVKDEIANMLSDRLNRNMYVLSVIAAIFLPLGFLTGLMGVNIGGMPGVDNSWAFWTFSWVLIVLVVIQVIIFKRLKWF